MNLRREPEPPLRQRQLKKIPLRSEAGTPSAGSACGEKRATFLMLMLGGRGQVRARQWASGQDGTFSPRVHLTARSREYMFKCYVETDVFCCNKHKKYMPHQKSSFSPLTITRHVSETSPSEDVWQSGSSVQPKFSAANASMRRTAGTSPVIPLSSGVSLVAGTQPLCLGARN